LLSGGIVSSGGGAGPSEREAAGWWPVRRRGGARRVRRPTDLFHRFARASAAAVGITRRRRSRRSTLNSRPPRALLCERYSDVEGARWEVDGARGPGCPRTFLSPYPIHSSDCVCATGRSCLFAKHFSVFVSLCSRTHKIVIVVYYIIIFFPSVSRWFLLLSSSLLLSKRINIYYHSKNSLIFYYLYILYFCSLRFFSPIYFIIRHRATAVDVRG